MTLLTARGKPDDRVCQAENRETTLSTSAGYARLPTAPNRMGGIQRGITANTRVVDDASWQRQLSQTMLRYLRRKRYCPTTSTASGVAKVSYPPTRTGYGEVGAC